MAWMALKRQKIKRNGEYITVERGDIVPEADDWLNVDVYIRQGYIQYVSDSTDSVSITRRRRGRPRRELSQDIME
jgi:hypothetical protein